MRRVLVILYRHCAPCFLVYRRSYEAVHLFVDKCIDTGDDAKATRGQGDGCWVYFIDIESWRILPAVGEFLRGIDIAPLASSSTVGATKQSISSLTSASILETMPRRREAKVTAVGSISLILNHGGSCRRWANSSAASTLRPLLPRLPSELRSSPYVVSRVVAAVPLARGSHGRAVVVAHT